MSNKWLDFGGIKKRVAKEFDYTFPPSGKTKMNAIDDLVKGFKAGSTKSAARIQMALLNNELGREVQVGN